MEIMFLLIPLSVILVFLIGVAFWWSLRSGQYDDLEGPAYRVLMDKDKPDVPPTRNDAEQSQES
jgi:cbb3-type cytochrome oxidase maturation protein